MTLHQALVAAFNHVGLPRKILAEQIGATNGMLSEWLNGRKSPNPENLARFAAACGVRITLTEDCEIEFLPKRGRKALLDRRKVDPARERRTRCSRSGGRHRTHLAPRATRLSVCSWARR
jgi:transcriptional regulator with XRE-family HTH domain